MGAKLLLLLLVLGYIQGGLVLLAQRDEDRAIILQAPPDEAISFQAVSLTGEVTPVGSLPPEFRLVNFQGLFSGADWLIDNPGDITLSPDKRYTAFSAASPNERRIFLYTVSGEVVWSAPIAQHTRIQWSPDSSGFVFAQTTLFEGADDMAYYEMETGQLVSIPVTLENQLVRRLQWLNAETLVFDLLEDGTTLETITLDGEMRQLFTEDDVPEGLQRSICEREWSAHEQVLYLGVGCTGSPEAVLLEALYTVDLNANISPILMPPAELQRPELYQAYFLIGGIEIHEDNTYVVTEEYTIKPDETGDVEQFMWRVLRFNTGQVSEVYTATADTLVEIENPQISPDGRYLTVGFYAPMSADDIVSKLLVIDLQTGTIIREVDGAGNYGWSVDWLNHHSFLYSDTYGSEACHCAYPTPGSRTLLVDLSKYAVLDLSDRLAGSTWLFSNS